MALMFFLCLSSGVKHLIVAPQHTHYCYSYTIHRTKERGYILPVLKNWTMQKMEELLFLQAEVVHPRESPLTSARQRKKKKNLLSVTWWLTEHDAQKACGVLLLCTLQQPFQRPHNARDYWCFSGIQLTRMNCEKFLSELKHPTDERTLLHSASSVKLSN